MQEPQTSAALAVTAGEAASDPKTALGAGLIPLAPGRDRYTLSTGKVADVRKGKGRDLRLAARMAGDDSEPIAYEFALVAIKALINGQPVTIEDIDELSDVEASELLGICRGKVQTDAEKEAAKAKAASAAPSPPST